MADKEPDFRDQDPSLDATLRPASFEEFIGQRQVIENLRTYIKAAELRGEPLDHILFSGLPGLGKTTLSYLIAREIGSGFKTASGPVLDRAGDLAGILTNLQKGDIFFIDEIHRVNRTVEEYLYSAMEDFSIDIMIDQGPSARSVRIDLQPFTLIGATTREGLLTGPFRSRFGVFERLELYPAEDLKAIIDRSSRIFGVSVDEEAGRIIASRARGTPRLANRYLRRIRDVAQAGGSSRISATVAVEGFRMLGIDTKGLSQMDRNILCTIHRMGGGPVGLKTVAVSVGEETDTLEEVYEPFLIQNHYLVKTPRGRMLTPEGSSLAEAMDGGSNSKHESPTLF
jgi:Holliday junction DNA helicase RuvB